MPLGIGIIGAGKMGTIHAEAAAVVAEARLVAVADVDEGRARSIVKQHKLDHCFTDYGELLELEEVEAVVIATPDALHREAAVAAAEAGKHILLEKPIATSLADADQILAAAEAANIKLAIGYCSRYDPAHAQIKHQIESGSLGTVLSIYCRRNNLITEPRRLGGRVLVEQYLAVHDVDLILWYLQDEVVRVTAEIVEGPVQEELGVPDICWLMLKTARGSVAVVECGWVLPESHGSGDIQFEVTGSLGTAHATVVPSPVTVFSQEGLKRPDVRGRLHGELVGWYRDQVRCFVQAVQRDEPLLVTGLDGRRSLEIVLAARRSYTEGGAVTLPLE